MKRLACERCGAGEFRVRFSTVAVWLICTKCGHEYFVTTDEDITALLEHGRLTPALRKEAQ